MFVQGNNVEIQRNDLLQENAFKIKATGKAFKILSDGLYADKIKAVIRELSCNAFDAHVAAGTQSTPFEVHLPNTIEPHFTVRDFGIGLSKEACQELFTTYFESTKTTSNDFIGALGLGSKSPFSYVDAFTVISRFNGVKYTFSAFIGEDEMPKIALMGEEATDEGNGLEVSMPVRRNDFSVFYDRASSVLKRFNPLPKITGYTIALNPEKPLLSGSCWRLMNHMDRWGYSNRGAVAIQGKIEYPINRDALHEAFDHAQLAMFGFPFEIDFDIGDLEIAASREALGYKKPTIDAIKAKLEILMAELPAQFQSKFDNVRSIWEAHYEYGKMFNQGGHMSYIIRELNNASGGIKFKALGQTISGSRVSVKFSDYPSLVVKEFNAYSTTTTSNFKERADLAKTNRHASETFSVEVNDQVVFFKNDLKVGPSTRINRFTKQRGNYTKSFFVTGDDAEVEQFFKDLGEPPVHTTGELPKPTKAQSTKVKARVFENGRWAADNEIDLDEGTPGLFLYYARWTAHTDIKSDCGTINQANRKFTDFEFGQLVEKLIEFKIIEKDTRIVGMNKLMFDKTAADTETEWQDFGKFIANEYVAKCLNNQKYLDEVAEMRIAQEVQGDYYTNRFVEALRAKVNDIDVNSPIHEFLGKIKAVKTVDFKKVSSFLELAEQMGHVIQSSKGDFNIQDEMQLFRNRYEMLNMANSYYWADNIERVVRYINQVEMVNRINAG